MLRTRFITITTTQRYFIGYEHAQQGIRELDISLHAVGRTYDAIVRLGVLADYSGLVRYPYGHEGGLMKLVAEVVGLPEPGRVLDGAIYLMNPVESFVDISRGSCAEASVRDPPEAFYLHRCFRTRLDRDGAHHMQA